MDVTCGINKKKMEIHGRFQWETPKEGDLLEALCVNGRILFMCILNKRMEGRGMNSSNSGEGFF